jgi:hypothetical protein
MMSTIRGSEGLVRVQDSPSDESDRPKTGASIIGTPGRIISGVFSFLSSPWSRKREDLDDSLDHASDADSTDNGPAVQRLESSGCVDLII